MAFQNLNEVFNFVNKFLNLRKNNENETLSLECPSISTFRLPSYPPPQYEPHPPTWSSPCYRPSPSRVRCSLRRAEARTHAAEKANNEQVSPAHAPHILAEQAAADIQRVSSVNQFDTAEAALRNKIASDYFNDDVEDNNAEKASDKMRDKKIPFNLSEADTAEQAARLPADDSKEKVILKA